MAKVGRNQPCPCGSGKKYKLCCLPADDAAATAARGEQRRNAPPPPLFGALPGRRLAVVDDDARFEQMSNEAVDLIHAGKLDDAARLCHRLLEEFPELPDGHIRFGQLFRARGAPKQAASHLRQAAAVARTVNDDPALPLSLEQEADSLDPPAP
jgi:tetratricopeptide (TPR) repeat protein